MADETFYLKTGDNIPLEYEIDTDTDLAAATIKFKMRARAGGEAVIDAVAVLASVDPDELRYDWAEGDTDIAGNFVGEFEITSASGQVETWPSVGFIEITITAGI